MNKANMKKWLIPVVTIFLLATILTVGNYIYCKSSPGGTDFLVHWMGARQFITRGISPYSDDTARQIQIMVYGRPAIEGEHLLRVAYPLYSIILFGPFALIPDFTFARSLWMTLLEMGVMATAYLSLKISEWKPKRFLLIFFGLFLLLSYHGLRSLINGNVIILITVMLLGAILAIKHRQDEAAGLLLAFATIKPQVVVLVIGFVFWWALWNRRQKIIRWFLGTLIILVLIAMLLIPDWIMQNLREILRYPSYNPPGTLAGVMHAWWPNIGLRIGTALSVIVGLIIAAEWWLGRRSQSRWFIWIVFITLAMGQWIGLQTDPGNFYVLLPCLALIFKVLEERWPRMSRRTEIITMLALFLGLWALFLATAETSYQVIQSPVMMIPMPLVCMVGLYWVRWWVSRNQQLIGMEP